MPVTKAEFRKRLVAQVGKKYVLGQPIPHNTPLSKMKAADCSGLIVAGMNDMGIVYGDRTAAGLWNTSKAVSSPAVGDLVFLANHSGRKPPPGFSRGIGHVAWITSKLSNGDWEIVEAKGSKYGIIRTTLSAWKKRAYYAGIRRMPELKFTTEPPKPETTPVITEAMLKSALASVGSSTTRSKVVTRIDGTTKTSTPTSLKELAALATEALKRAPKLTGHGVAAWVATLMQESAWLATTVEYGADKKKYDPYRGRTFEQVTWKDNYASFGKWAKEQGWVTDANLFVTKPEGLGDLKWAWYGGIWYFENRKLWGYGNSGDFQRVSTAVNLGTARIDKVPAGWQARLKAYRAFLSIYAKPSTIKENGVMDVPTQERLQEYLGAEIDAIWGAQTWFLLGKELGLATPFNIGNPTHVKALQKKVGLKGKDVDGVWWQPVSKKYGPVTTKAVQVWLNKNR